MRTLALPFAARVRAGLGGAALLAAAWVAVVLAVAAAMPNAAWRVGVLLLVAPLAEEALFRAGLHEALLRRAWPAWAANGAVALAFGAAHALHHGSVQALAVALPAMLIGWVYQQGRRLRNCVALHAAMNALWLAWTLAAPMH